MFSQSVSKAALLCMFSLTACAGWQADDTVGTAQPNKGNGTVRAVIYVEAARNAAVAASRPASARSVAAGKAAAARNRQDKRSAAQAALDKHAKPAAAAPQASASADSAGLVIAPHVAVTASGFRYTYTVELDAGGAQTFGFASDQGFSIGDRVLVSGGGLVAIPK